MGSDNAHDYLRLSGTSVKLTDRYSWSTWYLYLKINAKRLGIWNVYVNPDSPDSPPIIPEATLEDALLPTFESIYDDLANQRAEKYQSALQLWEASDPNTRGAQPSEPPEPTVDEVDKELDRALKIRMLRNLKFSLYSTGYNLLWTWVEKSVDKRLYQTALLICDSRGTTTLQGIVRFLKKELGLGASTTQDIVRQEYRNVLIKALAAGTNRERWLAEYRDVLARARAYRIPEVEGTLADKDFQWACTALSRSRVFDETV